jgi:hypothetical protein
MTAIIGMVRCRNFMGLLPGDSPRTLEDWLATENSRLLRGCLDESHHATAKHLLLLAEKVNGSLVLRNSGAE